MFLYFIAIKISFVSKTAFSIYQVRLSNPFATKLVFTLCLPALKDVYFFVKCILRKTQLRYAIREINNSVQFGSYGLPASNQTFLRQKHFWTFQLLLKCFFWQQNWLQKVTWQATGNQTVSFQCRETASNEVFALRAFLIAVKMHNSKVIFLPLRSSESPRWARQ